MSESYLDISKSVMISSPAGSGKTEKLSRRYIELLKSGSDVERILAITFTEKAAAEMKERILNILKKEDPEMFNRVREKMPRMRISTIHAFCLKLLKRFCVELEMDPSLEVMDSFNADILWSEAIYESLLEDNSSGEGLFYHAIKQSGIKGWNKLYRMLYELHGKRPAIEAVICGRQPSPGNHEYLEKIMTIYEKCLKRYKRKKIERHCLDYNDLELMAYEAISKNPEWQNVLYSFDEHTDHILVDEFQDTSSLQWKIIDKLTEEWRSGSGAKREKGVKPTIFLVGDDKQSIYSFRGANVSIFKNARKKLTDWLRDEYHFIEIKENYRSLPVIIDFVNTLFERLMPKGLYDDYKVEYAPFEAARTVEKGSGAVELMLIDGIGNTKDNRKSEASVIADKIKELYGRYEIYEGGAKRPCGYGDMAVLLRNRTHLSVFEDAMRKADIPFVVLKGIGFYNEPEVRILKDMLFFLIDPMDDYSLFGIMRSPLFSISYDAIFEIIESRVIEELPAGYLYDALNGFAGKNPDSEIAKAVNFINKYLDGPKNKSYAGLLEDILSGSQAWQYFHEKQRYVNVKKFIRLVEEFESKGITDLELREKLIKASAKSDEAKANVNIEGINAVRIMTVHASKGLQFPMVFLPCLDEESRAKSAGSIAMEENGSGILIAYEEDSAARRTIPLFQRQNEKLLDEEKRLFYVAATRAMDYLCMSGVLKDNPTGKLTYLYDAFDLGDRADASIPFKIDRIRKESARSSSLIAYAKKRHEPSAKSQELSSLPIFTASLDHGPKTLWLDVTEEMEHIRRKHGEDWIVLGRAFHRAFEGISKGYVTMDVLDAKIEDILKNEILSDDSIHSMKEMILSDIKMLDSGGYLRDIIMPRENSYSELPFIIETGNKVYKGRIDRVIIEDDSAIIYDYKTYPISEKEIPDHMEKYSFQMKIYRDAVEKLFELKAKAFIFFTHESRLIQAG
jgi:ATP-dependent helicase/nuclease subunit A